MQCLNFIIQLLKKHISFVVSQKFQRTYFFSKGQDEELFLRSKDMQFALMLQNYLIYGYSNIYVFLLQLTMLHKICQNLTTIVLLLRTTVNQVIMQLCIFPFNITEIISLYYNENIMQITLLYCYIYFYHYNYLIFYLILIV